MERKNPYAMLIFEGLWGHCDKNGNFEWRPRQLKLDILPFLEFDMAEKLDALCAAGFIKKYTHGDKTYGEIQTFEKHQRINGKEKTEPGKYPKAEIYDEGSNWEALGKQRGSTGEATGTAGREEEGKRKGKGIGTESPKPAAPAPSADVLALTEQLIKAMTLNDPKAKIPANLARWHTEADRLLRLDKRPISEVSQVLAWSQADGFWKANILSLPKFREKYPTLRAQWERSKPKDLLANTTESELAVLLAYKQEKGDNRTAEAWLALYQRELLPHCRSLLEYTAGDVDRAASLIADHRAEMEGAGLNWSLKSAANSAWQKQGAK